MKKNKLQISENEIEKEMQYYFHKLAFEVVYLNCDIPEKGNFYWYFKNHFDIIKLKALITSGKKVFDLFNTKEKNSIYILYRTDKNEVKEEKFELKTDGDFRNEEIVDFLQQSDVAIGYPDEKIQKDYIKQMLKHNKKFLIIVNRNIIKDKEIFRYIKKGFFWCGVNIPQNFETKNKQIKKQQNKWWMTNIWHYQLHNKIDFKKTFAQGKYLKLENYDAIDIQKLEEIPDFYNKKMAVPIDFMLVHNPKQFKLINVLQTQSGKKKTWKIIIKKNEREIWKQQI